MNGGPEKRKPQKAAGKSRRRPSDEEVIKGQIREMHLYWTECVIDARLTDADIKATTMPLGSEPRETIPQRNWATIQDDPGEHYGGPKESLLHYQTWLIRLKQKGLYDGPVELTVVNRKDTDGTTE